MKVSRDFFQYLLFSLILLVPDILQSIECGGKRSITNINKNVRTLQTKWTKRTVYEYSQIEYGVYYSDERKFLNYYKQKFIQGGRLLTELWNPIGQGCKTPSFGRYQLENSIDGPLELKQINDVLQPLHLTVHTKNIDGSYPVMVYIGDYDLMYPKVEAASPGFLLEKDIVLVSVQYRTAAVGFLSMRNDLIPGNAGILDIALALKWIRKFISLYGGDPQRVTLFGQYKAAGLIHVLMLSGIGENLFQQVILQSGSALLSNFTTKYPVKYSRKVGLMLGCPDVKDKVKLTKCLVEADDFALNSAYNKVWDAHKGNIPFVTVGGPSHVLHNFPDNIHRSGQFRIYPKIVGFVDQPSAYFFDLFDPYPSQASLFTLERFSKDAITLINLAGEIFGKSPLQHLMPNATTLSQLENANPRVLEQTFNLVVTSVLDWSSFYVKSAMYYTGFLNKTPKTYAYTFKYNGKSHTLPSVRGSLLDVVMLLDDNRYLFSREDHQLDEADTEIAKVMVDLWTSFAAFGEPQSTAVKKWPEVKVGVDEYLIIDEKISVGEEYVSEFQSAVSTYLSKSEMDWYKQFQ